MSFLEAVFLFFFFNDTATTEIYTLSLHDALPISRTKYSPYSPTMAAGIGRCGSLSRCRRAAARSSRWPAMSADRPCSRTGTRSEEHTSELQSQSNLVCRLLLEKKKTNKTSVTG